MKRQLMCTELSIVVQGAIAGTSSDPYEQQWTHRACESIRKYFPGAEIILSTWKGSNHSGVDFDILVESDDPGSIAYYWLGDGIASSNLNRMIVSTVSGLKAASRKFSIRMRTDMYFTSDSCLAYWGKFRNFTPEKLVEEKIVTLTSYRDASSRPFYVCDFFALGLTKDLLLLWDVPLLDACKPVETRMPLIPWHIPTSDIGPNSEQYIFTSFLKKSFYYRHLFKCNEMDEGPAALKHNEMNNKENSALLNMRRFTHNKSIADNLVIATADLLGIESFKYPGHSNFKKNAETKKRFISHLEWKRLYAMHCEKHSAIHWVYKVDFFYEPFSCTVEKIKQKCKHFLINNSYSTYVFLKKIKSFGRF